jgi:hypothetical protein
MKPTSLLQLDLWRVDQGYLFDDPGVPSFNLVGFEETGH